MRELQLLADVIQKSMGLTESQIWLFNQRRTIPTTTELFVSIHRDAVRVMGNNSKQSLDTVTAYQHFQAQVSIHAFSRSLDAMDRVPEILGAIRSPYSLYIQEKYGVRFSAVPTSVVDASDLEGAAMLYRTVLTIQVFSAAESTTAATYFDPDTVLFSVEETEA